MATFSPLFAQIQVSSKSKHLEAVTPERPEISEMAVLVMLCGGALLGLILLLFIG
jgi:hypothetical protein